MENKEIFTTISNVTSEIKAVPKNRNHKQGYKFRSVDDIFNAVNPLLSKYKLIIIPNYTIISNEVLESQEGKRQIRTVVQGNFKLYALDGSFLEVQIPGEGIDSLDKSMNKAMSNALKYCYIQVFSISTEEEEIPDEDNLNRQEVEKKPSQKTNDDLITEKQVKYIKNLIGYSELKEKKILESFKVSTLNELPKKKAFEIIKSLEEAKKINDEKKEKKKV